MNHRLPHLASMEQINQWADRYDARAELPNIVRSLIKGSNDTLLDLRMGGGATVDYRGYDGKVVTTTQSTFVPAGVSAWEMGVGPAEAKANKDYKKRSDAPGDVVPSETTFVFVTPRLWAGAEAWAAKKRLDGKWKDVQVKTASELFDVMEDVPAVHIRFSEMNGIPANGVRTLRAWWDAYVSATSALLTPALVLSGRSSQAEELMRLLDEKQKAHLYVEAQSIDDVMAFVAATLIESADAGFSEHLERALVVFEPGALLYLGEHQKLLILIPFTDSLLREAELATENTVILRVGQASPSQLKLPRIPIAAAKASLVAQGVEADEAQRLAVAAYRSVPLLRARLRGEPTLEADAVTQTLVSDSGARRLWLLGGWTSDRTGDLEVVSGLIGSEFDGSRLTTLTTNADPIFTKVGSSWRVIAPEIHVDAIAKHLSPDDLNQFEAAIQTVLGAVDPTLELPQRERWKAGLYGPGRLHSTDLRTGIATTLAAFGAMGAETQLDSGATASGWAALVVRAVLDRAHDDESGQLWLSLMDLLPLLAEAAPSVFISALERELDDQGPLQSRIFSEVDDPMASGSPHVYLLWALESLAWSEEYLSPAVSLLARLVELDPGGKLSNRPARSLEDIFRPWLPQTAASLEQRLDVLRSVIRRYP